LTGSTRVNATQTSGSPQAPSTVAYVAPRIMGSKNVAQSMVLSFSAVADAAHGANIPHDGANTFTVRRGDARADGVVNISDALFIAQYLAGIRQLGSDTDSLHAVNAASAKSDGMVGDQVTIADSLYIAQMLAGLRDDCYNTVP